MRTTTYCLLALIGVLSLSVFAAQPRAPERQPERSQKGEPAGKSSKEKEKSSRPLADAIEEAQTPRKTESKRPEQKLSKHDSSDIFSAEKADPSSEAFDDQPDKGRMNGFDFYRDPLNAEKPK